MRKVYKYGTGEEIPENAVYLKTIIENREIFYGAESVAQRLVWHYFLVEL